MPNLLHGLPSTSPARPAYMVGLDPEGRWVAVETHGLAGGLFRSREAALDYAEAETDHRPGAVLFAETPLQLAL